MPFRVNEANEDCAICADTTSPLQQPGDGLGGSEVLFQLECNHGGPGNAMHWDCLQRNINANNANSTNCPICRTPISQEDQAHLQTAENMQEIGATPVPLTQDDIDQQELDELNAQIDQLVQQEEGEEGHNQQQEEGH